MFEILFYITYLAGGFLFVAATDWDEKWWLILGMIFWLPLIFLMLFIGTYIEVKGRNWNGSK